MAKGAWWVLFGMDLLLWWGSRRGRDKEGVLTALAVQKDVTNHMTGH